MFIFIFNSILLGIGLAMDAFSVSIANALNEQKMSRSRMSIIAGVYAFFQFAMPMAGWLCVHTIIGIFSAFQKFIPWIALVLLLYIGGKMIFESLQGGDGEENGNRQLSAIILLLQGIATSIDALSVGFTIADYSPTAATAASLIIAAVTFAICIGGLMIGKKIAGHTEKQQDEENTFSHKAELLGGSILIFIGIEIFVRGAILHI